MIALSCQSFQVNRSLGFFCSYTICGVFLILAIFCKEGTCEDNRWVATPTYWISLYRWWSMLAAPSLFIFTVNLWQLRGKQYNKPSLVTGTQSLNISLHWNGSDIVQHHLLYFVQNFISHRNRTICKSLGRVGQEVTQCPSKKDTSKTRWM